VLSPLRVKSLAVDAGAAGRDGLLDDLYSCSKSEWGRESCCNEVGWIAVMFISQSMDGKFPLHTRFYL
jgi:hypothetical protein